MAYDWPLEPFDTPHPVRAYFNDPRISGTSRAFHFGIDISAPNGTPVYAVEAGQVHLEDPRAISVATGDLDFGYWHVVPVVAHRQVVSKHQLLGHVQEPWLHVHFAEHREGTYRNPLRPGALTPWRDTTKPQVTSVTFSRNGKALAGTLSGSVDLIAEAHDTTPLLVPPPWDNLPVTAATVRWRVRQGVEVVRPWHMPIDFTKTLLPQTDYARIYAPGTRQNRAGKPGLYRLYLAHTWDTKSLPDGAYEVDVEAADLAGNTGALSTSVAIGNNV